MNEDNDIEQIVATADDRCAQSEPPTISVGDVVRLKSGGTSMTVVAMTERHCTVAWFQPQDGSGMLGFSAGQVLRRDNLAIAALEKYSLTGS